MATNTLPTDARPVPSVGGGDALLSPDLERLVAAPDCYFEAGFSAFVGRLEEAFKVDEQGVEDQGVDAIKRRRELHAEVIRLMHHARARNLAGDYALARKVIQLLPEWFNAQSAPADAPLNPKPPESAIPVRAAKDTTTA